MVDWLAGLVWIGFFLREAFKDVQQFKDLIHDLMFCKAFGDLSGIDNIKF